MTTENQKLFTQNIEIMEDAFRRLERQAPSPGEVFFREGIVYRYAEKSVEQALIQKLARMISGLHAAKLLIDHGFFQEQGVIQRTLDELNDDILFLAAGIFDELTDLHKRYLKSFYQEDGLATTKKPDRVPQKKIQAYLVRVLGVGLNPSRSIDAANTISNIYSGFVHAASPHIMDMYGGNPLSFHIAGMLGTPHVDSYQHDYKNYLYRGLLSVMVVAKVFGDKPLVDSLSSYINKFQQDNLDLFPSPHK